jgi:seryl-tRNA synthetase
MKYLAFILLLTGCTTIGAQDGEALAKEREFDELVKKTSANLDLSLSIQAKASEKQTQIVDQTVSKITTLKTEVTQLKTELKDVKEKLDSVSTDTGVSFIILPISKDQENRSGLSGNYDSTTRRLY